MRSKNIWKEIVQIQVHKGQFHRITRAIDNSLESIFVNRIPAPSLASPPSSNPSLSFSVADGIEGLLKGNNNTITQPALFVENAPPFIPRAQTCMSQSHCLLQYPPPFTCKVKRFDAVIFRLQNILCRPRKHLHAVLFYHIRLMAYCSNY